VRTIGGLMGIITTILLIFLIIVILVLIIPFHISLRLQKNGGRVEGLFELKWLKVRIFKKDFPEEEKLEVDEEEKISEKIEEKEKAEEKEKLKKEKKTLDEKKKDKKEKRKWKWDDIKKILKLVFASGNYFIQFLGDILKSISLDRFNMHLILGMDSTSDTATYVGYIWATASLLNLSPPVHISAEPSFFNQRMDGELFLELEIRLIRPLLATLRLLSRKPVLKLLWELRKLRS
jgi:hypothetical protein